MTSSAPVDALVDAFGRVHRSLRISLTDRCDLRCTYCMPATGLDWIRQDHLLTADEIVRIVRVAVSLGVTTVRFTGGEPLLRPDLVSIVGEVRGLFIGLSVGLTTNGVRLPELADDLAAAGLDAVTVSLDTLSAARFARLTRRDRLPAVLAGLEAARRSGIPLVKANAVLLPGLNDDEAVALLAWCLEQGVSLRFIEQMPLGPPDTWDRATMVTREQILRALAARWDLAAIARTDSRPAESWLVDGGPARVGIIASVTAPFCGSCDRLRLTADGQIRNCLFATGGIDVRGVLRRGGTDDDLAAALQCAVGGKKAGHGIGDPDFHPPERLMHAIGG